MSEKRLFETTTDDNGFHLIVNTETSVPLDGAKFKPENGEFAESACDEANKFARLGRPKLKKLIDTLDPNEKGAEFKRKILLQIQAIVHPPKEKSVPPLTPFKPKEKDRSSYNSAARNSFSVQANITDKEGMILEQVETITQAGNHAFGDDIAGALGITVNVVAGAASVLLSKGVITSYREKNETKQIRRAYRITFPEWREKLGASDVERKAKAVAKAADQEAKRETVAAEKAAKALNRQAAAEVAREVKAKAKAEAQAEAKTVGAILDDAKAKKKANKGEDW